MSDYIPTIGLEIHAELKTRTKMFCDSRNDPDETRPNVNVCPVCMGHPGTLPTINREAVKQVLKVGVALGGTLADKTCFDRKNYFYPDIPKGYQISQYRSPLVFGGFLNGIAITRVHLEEDTATSLHYDRRGDNDDNNNNNEGGESHRHGNVSSYSLIDFNRAGVPLMELVTEPVIHSAEEAAHFARELQLLLRYLGASDGNMEKGEMRVEANISIAQGEKIKTQKLGTKVEVKNLNSFKAVERAIEYEVRRQAGVLDEGGEVVQETRGWDEQNEQTFSQRRKEESHDYRYFPEPDLPRMSLFEISGFSAEAVRKSLPELPAAKRERYLTEGIRQEYADMFVADERLGKLFEETAAEILKKYDNSTVAKTLASNYIGSDIAGLVSRCGIAGLARITAKGLAAVMSRVILNEISSRGAKNAIAEVFQEGGDLSEVSKKYLQTSSVGELEEVVRSVILKNENAVADYKNGKGAALQFLVGQGMKATKGAANPETLRELIKKLLN